MFYQDIPRIYTAIAEWCACMEILYSIKKDKLKDGKFWIFSLTVLAIQIIFLELTGNVSKYLWVPCMVVAITLMYGFLKFVGDLSWLSAGFSCAKAFLIAEFIASLEWQIFTFFQANGYGCSWLQILLTVTVYGLVLVILLQVEKSFEKQDYLKEIAIKEVLVSAGIAVVIFGFSNLSFIYNDLPFTSSFRPDIFFIRTLVDFAGIAIIYVYQSRICEYIASNELSAMNAVLKSQYDQYRNYQDSLELIHMKYHDLKHQIAGLRMETDEERRKKWIEAMEEEISTFETLNKTGNQVLDTILAAKIFHCRKHKIQFTCVADGKLLQFMHVTDVCSIFGNALDNAIEHVMMIPEEKRLIHISVSSKKGFVFIKIENYCEEKLTFSNGKFIATSKQDKENHGFGMKSICAAAEKYGGTVDFGQENNWFILKILLPRG